MSPQDKKQLDLLIERYNKGIATPEEAAFVEAYYQYFDVTQGNAPVLSPDERVDQERRMLSQMQTRIQSDAAPAGRLLFLRKYYLRAAAIVGGVVIAGVIYVQKKKDSSMLPAPSVTAVQDAAPGGNRAILTLSNGSTILLDSTGTGGLAQQGDIKISRQGKNELVYTGKATGSALVYNTMRTQKGGQYHLQLPDGTKAWLNSESSIHFPVAFNGGRREVEVTGEVYFDVAKSKTPFIVHVDSLTAIEVLGTQFNVMAYPDESAIRTTLVAGSVRVRADKGAAMLRPGEQAASKIGETGIEVKTVDTEKETAWISGFFQFENTDLPTLMRQLQRWYDVEPVYKKKDNGRRFGGRISKSLPLSEMLRLLESNDIHFAIEGKKLIVQ